MPLLGSTTGPQLSVPTVSHASLAHSPHPASLSSAERQPVRAAPDTHAYVGSAGDRTSLICSTHSTRLLSHGSATGKGPTERSSHSVGRAA
jgi:hypothetical protein